MSAKPKAYDEGEFSVVGGEGMDEENVVETGMIVAPQPMQHLVVGVGSLAAMSDADFDRNIEMLVKGQDRIAALTDKLLVKGVDYGHVPGIKKPFLQKPGADKLANFYGLAVRFEADRVEGTRIVIDGLPTDLWNSPPLAYHVRAYVHLRDFDGPVVGMGFGEANSWEPKYRWLDGKPSCPLCGREGLVKGKEDGKLQGKWWCPGWKGGCNQTFEAADDRIAKPGKVENSDPYGLANTLVKMGEKRAGVDGILRVTGTSGFFTQDEDSPSVQAQADDAPTAEPDPAPRRVEGIEVARGGKANAPTKEQIDRLRTVAKEKGLGPDELLAVFSRVLDTTPPVFTDTMNRAERGRFLIGWIADMLTADQVGNVLHTLETGEIDATEKPEDMASAF